MKVSTYLDMIIWYLKAIYNKADLSYEWKYKEKINSLLIVRGQSKTKETSCRPFMPKMLLMELKLKDYQEMDS